MPSRWGITVSLLMTDRRGRHFYVVGNGTGPEPDTGALVSDAIARAEDTYNAGCSDWSPLGGPYLLPEPRAPHDGFNASGIRD